MACTINAAEIKRVKGMGFLNNKGTDLFNARVITVNGKITADQAMVIAEAAKKFGNGDVEFTTRLTVEVRGVHFDNIPAFQEYIAQAGLVTGGTTGLALIAEHLWNIPISGFVFVFNVVMLIMCERLNKKCCERETKRV